MAEALDYVEANGLRFAYLAEGEGPLVLLLHGFPDTPHGWAYASSGLSAAGFRVVAPYMRGYAPTEVPADRRITVEQLGEDAAALIEALGYRQAVVVGHDWGAAAAYCAASLAPERVRKLVAVGVPHPATVRATWRVFWVGRHFVYLRFPTAHRKMRRRNFRHVDELYRRWSPTWHPGPEETAPVKACFANADSLDAAIGYYRAFVPGKVSPAMRAKISMDTLVFAGRDDPALDVDAYHRAARKFTAGYRVVELPGGHFVHRESPEAFREHLLAFVGEAEASADG